MAYTKKRCTDKTPFCLWYFLFIGAHRRIFTVFGLSNPPTSLGEKIYPTAIWSFCEKQKPRNVLVKVFFIFQHIKWMNRWTKHRTVASRPNISRTKHKIFFLFTLYSGAPNPNTPWKMLKIPPPNGFIQKKVEWHDYLVTPARRHTIVL